MTAPTYDQLVAAIDRVVAAHYAEADEQTSIAQVLGEIEASIEAAADLAGRANIGRGDSTSDVASQGPARRLPAPTGQPVEFDRDTPPPAHARGGGSPVPDMRRVT